MKCLARVLIGQLELGGGSEIQHRNGLTERGSLLDLTILSKSLEIHVQS